MVNLKMNRSLSPAKRCGKALLAACLTFAMTAPAAQAQSWQKNKPNAKHHAPAVVWAAPLRKRTVTKPVNIIVKPTIVAPRRRTINQRNVYRRFGPSIYGYGFHYTDAAAARWLAFTGLTLSLIHLLDEPQVRYYEQAQIDATSAPIGETIIWNNSGASGSATAIREGQTTNGNLCREFRQTITIDGRFEEAYGTACLQDDGAWQIIS